MGQGLPDALRCFAVKQIERSDIAAYLDWACFLIVAGVPGEGFLAVLAEVMHLFHVGQEDAWVALE